MSKPSVDHRAFRYFVKNGNNLLNQLFSILLLSHNSTFAEYSTGFEHSSVSMYVL